MEQAPRVCAEGGLEGGGRYTEDILIWGVVWWWCWVLGGAFGATMCVTIVEIS